MIVHLFTRFFGRAFSASPTLLASFRLTVAVARSTVPPLDHIWYLMTSDSITPQNFGKSPSPHVMRQKCGRRRSSSREYGSITDASFLRTNSDSITVFAFE